MNKINEWAKLDTQMRFQISDRNEARAAHAGIVLTYYASDGNISQQVAYTQAEALALATWIINICAE